MNAIVALVLTALTGALSYREIGPAIAGGRVTAVAGSDSNALVYYGGGADGGVFKSTDGGFSWIPVFDEAPVAAIGAIAVWAHDPNDVWVGTGEANARNDVEAGDGVWRSTNGGKTWAHIGLENARYISTILLDPRDSNSAIAGVQGDVFRDNNAGGVYVTHDAGRHWLHTLYAGPASGTSDLAWNPARPQTIFAGIWQVRRTPWTLISGGSMDGVFRSDDGGVHWRRLSGNGLPAGIAGRIGISVASAKRVYAIVQSREGDLWRSDDGGNRWQKMPFDRLIGHRPFYFSRIFADPANPDRVIDLATFMSLSTNAGRSFHLIASNAGYDYHALWWSSDGKRIINGNDTGIVISADGGANWSQPHDLPVSEVYHVGLGSSVPDYQICVGLQDVNSWCGPSSSNNGVGVLNRDWDLIAPGDGMWSLFDPRNSQLIWSSETFRGPGGIFLTNLRTHQAAEISPYKRDSVGEPPENLRYRFSWEAPIAFTQDDPPHTLVGGNVVFSTTDYGQHWIPISPDLTRNDKSRQHASGGPITLDMSGAEVYDTILDVAPSPVDKGVIWVSTDDGLAQVTRDGGATWKAVTPPAIPAWTRLPTIEPSRFRSEAAFLAGDGHMNGDGRTYVFETNDFGATWRSISGDLPRGLFARVIRQDPVDPDLLYAGTQRGVYVTFDGGIRWSSLRLNMPATAVYDLEIQPERNDLVVGTHGRGVWILDDLSVLQRHANATHDGLLPPRGAYRMWQWAPILTFGPGPPLPRNDFYGPNAPPAAFDYYLTTTAKPRIEILDSSERIVRHLDDLPARIGVNRVTWDLNEDGPVKMTHAPAFNRGPDEGPEALPGSYTVRLVAGANVFTQPLLVKADPRDTETAEQYQARHSFLTELYGQLSSVDRTINTIDERLLKKPGSDGPQLVAIKEQLTANPRTELESLAKRPRLRERILAEIERLSFSYQAPTEADRSEADEFAKLLATCEESYANIK